MSRFAKIFHGLYPKRCLICHETMTLERYVCASCHGSLWPVTDYCTTCGGDLIDNVGCLHCSDESQPAIDHIIMGYHYQDAVRTAIVGLKFNRQVYMVRALSEWMNGVILMHQNWLSTIDAIVPMPVDRVRLAGRGFNQVHEIAKALQPALQAPILSNVLHKRAFTIPQSGLNRQARLTNLTDALSANAVSGHLLLLDDVMTTGKTLQHAARALKDAGAQTVTALVIAKA